MNSTDVAIIVWGIILDSSVEAFARCKVDYHHYYHSSTQMYQRKTSPLP